MPVNIKARLFGDKDITLASETLAICTSWVKKSSQYVAKDAELLQWFDEQLANVGNPYVLDIGANCGTFTLLTKFHPDAFFDSYEPNPVAYKALWQNLMLNGISNAVVFELAVMDKVGKMTLKAPVTETGLGCLGTPMRFNAHATYDVKTNTLDNLYTGFGGLDIIKIDVEGAEKFVLLGGQKIINQFRPKMLVECCEQNTQQFGYSRDDITHLLAEWNYKMDFVSEWDVWAVPK